MQSPSELLISENGRQRIMRLIRKFKEETGEDAIVGGNVTKAFQEWRRLQENKD